MGGGNDCECQDFETEGGGGVNENWIRWLDKRNEVRTAWMTLAATGRLQDQTGLATTSRQLRELGNTKNTAPRGVVRSMDELVGMITNADKLEGHPLGRLDVSSRERFASNVQFEDYMVDGVRHQHVGTFYSGDLTQKHGFTYEELFRVFALFGMGAELAAQAHHKFGWDVDRAKCQPRMHYNCPWSQDC